MATSEQSQQTSNTNTVARGGSPPTTTYWAKTYGGSSLDYAYSVQQTLDGGYVVTGVTGSFGAGDWDVWVLKLDSAGGVTWQKTYGGSGDDYPYSVDQTSDGGYIVSAWTGSFGAGGGDVWVLMLDSNGSVIWQKAYGGTGNDWASSLQQTSDGGYIAAGQTKSFGAGYWDVWALKLNSTGSVVWERTYGGTSDDYAYSIQQTSDGGYIVAGQTESFGAGFGDVWVLKLDSAGGVTWQKTYGGTGYDYAYSVRQTADGGYIVAGSAVSLGAGSAVWVLKLNSSGSVTWQKTYRGTGDDWAQSVQQTSDGGYVVAGVLSSLAGGGGDFWVLKLDSTGSVTWQKTYGGNSSDYAYSIQQTSDGGYVVAGQTESFGAGFGDVWVLKLDSSGSVVWDEGSGASTRTVSLIPSDFRAATSSTSITAEDSDATVQDTQVTPQDTHATVTVQSGGGTGQGFPVIIMLGVVAVVVVLILITVDIAKRIRDQPRIIGEDRCQSQSRRDGAFDRFIPTIVFWFSFWQSTNAM